MERHKDSNLRKQSSLDFKSNPLTTRANCQYSM
ncbi:hypothetical protein POVCU1_028090, partial [Plasmodium ovale curtisi]